MARTINEIYDEIIIEKEQLNSLNGLQPAQDNAQQLLANLNNNSKVAIWRLLFWIIAFGIWVNEKIFDQYKIDIEKRAKEIITGTALWYRDQTLAFQFGDDLVWNGVKYGYLTQNIQNKIIKRAAVIEVGGQVRIKVSKLDGSGLPTPLSQTEETALVSYLQEIKFAGTNIAVVNREADLLKLEIKIYYDPLVLNNQGQLLSNTSIKPAEVAINKFIESLPFNGKLDLSNLIDSIQASVGIKSPFINTAQAKVGNENYQEIQEIYTAEAGFMTIDPNNQLSQTITYLPYV